VQMIAQERCPSLAGARWGRLLVDVTPQYGAECTLIVSSDESMTSVRV
jgi:hypothetical protein